MTTPGEEKKKNQQQQMLEIRKSWKPSKSAVEKETELTFQVGYSHLFLVPQLLPDLFIISHIFFFFQI